MAGNIDNENVLVCGGNTDGYGETPISDCLKLDTKQNPGSWTPIENMKVNFKGKIPSTYYQCLPLTWIIIDRRKNDNKNQMIILIGCTIVLFRNNKPSSIKITTYKRLVDSIVHDSIKWRPQY